MSLIQSFAKLTFKPSSQASYRTYVAARTLHPKKFRSILSDVPIRPRSGWQVYMGEHIQEYKINGKVDARTGTAALAEKWRLLSDAEKKPWQDKCKVGVAAHTEALQKALENATPQQFHDENVLRRKYKLPVLKDPKAPRRPLNTYLLFITHLRETRKDELANMSQLDQAVYAGKLYKELSPEQKKPFDDKFKEMKEIYAKEMKQYQSSIQEIVPEIPKRAVAKKTTSKKESTKAKSAPKKEKK